MEDTTPQERIRQFLFRVGRDDDNGPVLGRDPLIRFQNVKVHFIELIEQIVREFDIGFIHFVNQQHTCSSDAKLCPRVPSRI